MSAGSIQKLDADEQPVKLQRQARIAPQPQMAVLEGEQERVRFVRDWPFVVQVDTTFLRADFELDSPQRAEWIDDDDYFLRNRDSIDTFTPSVDSNLPRKRRALAHTAFGERKTLPNKQDLFSKLPDELLLHVFRFLPRARDRSSSASVSMRWLKLLSHMQRKDFFIRQSQQDQPRLLFSTGDKKDESVDEYQSQEAAPESVVDVFDDDTRVERQPQWAIGDLSRTLEGKKATDVRLAAIAVGTGGRGGLGKLCVKGGGLAGGLAAGISDVGLSAIGLCCTALRSLILWDCPNITDEGITVIGKGCRLLQKVELLKCPLVGDAGVSSIAKNAALVSVFSLDECPLIGNLALHAVSVGCPELTYLDIRNCPLVGDDGLEAVVQNCKKLQKLKLHGLQMSDKVLMLVGLHCKALATLCLSCLDSVTEDGFLSFCNSSSEKVLKRLAVTSCLGFSDRTLVALGNSFVDLRRISLTRCEGISDQGLIDFLQIAFSLKILHVERCSCISGIGLTSALSSTTGSLKEIHFKKCDGIQDDNMGLLSPLFICDKSAVTSICLANCGGVGDRCVSLLGLLCNNQLTELNLTGLAHLTDEGLLTLLNLGGYNFSSVNVTGCKRLTDRAVSAIAKLCGRSLKSFVLDGCKMVTDVGLQAIGKHCVGLEDLDISQCNITDAGVRAVVSKLGTTLNSLNLSGCGGVTNQVLGVIEEGCQNLQDLNLKHCRGLTQKMVNKLSAKLWTCDILSL